MPETSPASAPKSTIPGEYDQPKRDFEHRWRGYSREVRGAVRYARAAARGETSEPDNRFVIFGPGRCGSSLLVSLLDSHPHISCQGELLRGRLLFPRAHRDRMLRLGPGTHRGFKLLSYQVTPLVDKASRPDFLRRMVEEEGFRLLRLYREDVLRHAVSNMYARLKGNFHTRGEHQRDAPRRYEFPVHELMEWMERIERRRQDELGLLDGVPHLQIEYGRDLEPSEAHPRTVARVCEFLGLEPAPVDTDLRRNTPQKLESIIENYDAVREQLAATRFARFLDA